MGKIFPSLEKTGDFFLIDYWLSLSLESIISGVDIYRRVVNDENINEMCIESKNHTHRVKYEYDLPVSNNEKRETNDQRGPSNEKWARSEREVNEYRVIVPKRSVVGRKRKWW